MSKLGRFRRVSSKFSSHIMQKVKLFTAGRLLVDTFINSKESFKASDYSLSNLS